MIFLQIFLLIIGMVLIINFLVKAYIVQNLLAIEDHPEMFGDVGEVESIYIHTLVLFSPIDISRRVRFLKPIVWHDWYKFVYRKTNREVTSLPPLDYGKTKHSDLVPLLREFRKENF